MNRSADQDSSTTTGPPPCAGDPGAEAYRRPAIEWEEEFEPMADSYCERNPLDPSCV